MRLFTNSPSGVWISFGLQRRKYRRLKLLNYEVGFRDLFSKDEGRKIAADTSKNRRNVVISSTRVRERDEPVARDV
jgi:hypothetical protein